MKRLLIFVLSVTSFAAIPADAVWQVQTASSSDANGGCWVNSQKGATGTDLSQGAALTITSHLSAVGTTTLTDSATDFANTQLGNCINISGQGTYVIQGFTDSQHVTVDRTLGTFSTTTGVIGGPILSLGHLCSLATAGNTAFFKADGTFSITSASTNVNGGTCAWNARFLIVGYTSNRTNYNTDAAPTIQTNISTSTQFSIGTAVGTAYNLILDGNSQTAATATGGGAFVSVTIKNFNTTSNNTNQMMFYNVLATANSASVLTSLCIFCEAYANTATPFNLTTADGGCFYCLSYSNTGASTDGFSMGANNVPCIFCTAYSNGRHGINASAGFNFIIANSYAESNTGTGFLLGTSTTSGMVLGLGYLSNGTNITAAGGFGQTTAITPNSSAFVSSTNLNTNSTANAGALLRNVALPATFLRGITPTYLDMGAARHQDPQNVTVGHGNVQ